MDHFDWHFLEKLHTFLHLLQLDVAFHTSFSRSYILSDWSTRSINNDYASRPSRRFFEQERKKRASCNNVRFHCNYWAGNGTIRICISRTWHVLEKVFGVMFVLEMLRVTDSIEILCWWESKSFVKYLLRNWCSPGVANRLSRLAEVCTSPRSVSLCDHSWKCKWEKHIFQQTVCVCCAMFWIVEKKKKKLACGYAHTIATWHLCKQTAKTSQ